MVGGDQIIDRVADLVEHGRLQMHDAGIAGQQEAGVQPGILAHVESRDRVGGGPAANPRGWNSLSVGPPPAPSKRPILNSICRSAEGRMTTCSIGRGQAISSPAPCCRTTLP